ncbi:MAG TPA: FAD-dependent oxidoreductase [Longimicrobiales bacterium]
MMAGPRVVILGGGPAGVGGAYYLRKTGRAQATVLEQQAVLGGNAGSFDVQGVRVDFGSHRLHHACDRSILADLEALIGDDLLSNPRRGRIRLRGRWVHFPLKPIDLMLRLDRRFAAGSLRDMVAGALNGRKNGTGADTFASVLQASLGPTICEHFYFPYARKLWGREPSELSGIQARKRVSAGTFSKLMKRLFRPPGSGRFYYPRHGYGQITNVLAADAARRGADIMTGARVTALEPAAGGGWTVSFEREGTGQKLRADYVWSTIPTPLVARMMRPAAPPEVLKAAGSISYRAMVLAYLVLDVDRFSTTDAHYFPEENVTMTRLSEPKNYACRTEPRGRTVLCAELPCSTEDALWQMSDADVGALVAADMERAGIPLSRAPIHVETRRLKQAYPIYLNGYEIPFAVLDEWAESLPDFLMYGRQALFAHDNTHHGLYMASAAVDCLGENGFDRAKWHRYRDIFATHVVED